MHHQPPSLFDPGMSALDDPAFREHPEAVGIWLAHEQVSLARCAPTAHIGVGGMVHDLDRNVVPLADCLRTAPCIARINKNL